MPNYQVDDSKKEKPAVIAIEVNDGDCNFRINGVLFMFLSEDGKLLRIDSNRDELKEAGLKVNAKGQILMENENEAE